MDKVFGGTKVTMHAPASNSQMMSFIIEDGDNIVVIDGGTEADADSLEKKLIERGGHVDLWIITHAHHDHIGAVSLILERKGIKIERMIFNFPKQKVLKDFFRAESEKIIRNRFLSYVNDAVKATERPKMGEYTVGGLKIEFIKTDCTIPSDNFNDSSLVFKVQTRGLPILFLGDLGKEGGEQLMNMINPEALSSAVCQAAHHGQNGVDYNFYKAISPKYVFWPTPKWLWTNLDGEGPFATLETRSWMEKLGTVNFTAFNSDITVE